MVPPSQKDDQCISQNLTGQAPSAKFRFNGSASPVSPAIKAKEDKGDNVSENSVNEFSRLQGREGTRKITRFVKKE